MFLREICENDIFDIFSAKFDRKIFFGQISSNLAPDVWLNVKITFLCRAEMVKLISCKALTQNVRDNTCFVQSVEINKIWAVLKYFLLTKTSE